MTEKKRQAAVKPAIDLTAQTVTFAIADGKAPLVLNMAKVRAANPDIFERLAYVGAAQTKVIDAAAVGREEPQTGRIRSNEEMLALKREGMEECIATLESGEWSRKADRAGGTSIRLVALMRVKGWTDYADAKARVQSYADRNYEGNYDDAFEFLTSAKAVLDMVAQIQRERLPEAKIDADAALSEI